VECGGLLAAPIAGGPPLFVGEARLAHFSFAPGRLYFGHFYPVECSITAAIPETIMSMPLTRTVLSSLAVALLATAPALVLAGCGHSQAKAQDAEACITIQQLIPETVQVDDSGITTEPIRMTINAQGRPEDLKGAQVIYIEDGVEKSAIPVGDLHPGAQTVTIPTGLRMASSSELFNISVVGPDGSETPDITMPLNGPNSVAPPAPPFPAPAATAHDEESDQPIATIAPGVDRAEVESIRQFNVTQVGITSMDAFARQTRGDDAKLPAQTFVPRGVNFKDGMLVKFSTAKDGQPVEVTSPLTQTKILATLAKPASYVPNNPSALMSAVVVIPVKITHEAESLFLVRAAHAESSDVCK
jgi:hypothetical protein